MPEVVGIRFKRCGRIYEFEINGTEVRRGDLVIVESEFGLSIGTIVVERYTAENPERDLKKVIRQATEEDLKQKEIGRAHV